VKCKVCDREVSPRGVSVAIFHNDLFLLTLCEGHAEKYIGVHILRRLKRMSGRAAWIQPELPLAVPRSRAG
jgi:hypothetical protein